jgi:hypothetical protein
MKLSCTVSCLHRDGEIRDHVIIECENVEDVEVEPATISGNKIMEVEEEQNRNNSISMELKY